MNIFRAPITVIKSYKDSENLFLSTLYLFLKWIHTVVNFVFRFIINKNFRHIMWLRHLKANALHQTTTYTALDRYPEIFSTVKEYFCDRGDVKILSYGCSTGEEVISLSRYLPKATITGAEINKHCLAICNKRKVGELIQFIHSTSSNIRNHGPYDAVFCMAVLQREPSGAARKGVDNIGDKYPFSKFDQQLIELDKVLNKNGLFIVHFTQYRFTDSAIAFKYEPYGKVTQKDYNAPIFDKNCNILKDEPPSHSIYIKIAEDVDS